MPLNNAQRAVADSDCRFRVLCGGRRVGKSYLAVRELARFARQPDKKCLYIAPTYQMCRSIIWTDLKERLGNLNWIARANESRLELELVNGSTIMLRSGDAGQSLRGGGYDFVVFDETSDIDSEIYYEVVRPALSAQKPPGSVLFCGTPKGFNWFKGLYDLGRGHDPDWASFQFTTLQGGQVPESEIAAAKRDLDERTFLQEYESQFMTYSGIIAYNFSQDNIVSWKPHPAKNILIGVDFNVHPMSATVMVQSADNKTLHAIDEIVIYGSNTHEMCDEIKNRYPGNNIIVFPDPAGVQRKSSANGRTDISILQNAGFRVLHRPRHPAVKDRINAMNSLLKNAEGEIRFFVDPKCKHLIQSLQRYVYKQDTQIPEKGKWDHMFDATTYCVEYMYPVTKKVEIDNTIQTFGVY